jgi:hypothetical protein
VVKTVRSTSLMLVEDFTVRRLVAGRIGQTAHLRPGAHRGV